MENAIQNAADSHISCSESSENRWYAPDRRIIPQHLISKVYLLPYTLSSYTKRPGPRRYLRHPNAILISSHRHLILMKFAIAYQPSLQFSAACTRPNQTYNIYVEGSRRLQHTRLRRLHASARFHSAFLLSPYALARRDIDGVECRSTPGMIAL